MYICNPKGQKKCRGPSCKQRPLRSAGRPSRDGFLSHVWRGFELRSLRFRVYRFTVAGGLRVPDAHREFSVKGLGLEL